MNREGLTTSKRCSAVLWLVLVVMCLTLTSNCQAGKMALLLKQSPVDGGSVEPGTGVHRIEGNSQITLRAVPQPGYQFVTWLGDVDEPASPVTEAYMDSPKIVIAVFERSQYESIEAAEIMFSSPGGGGLIASAADISRSSGGGAGGRRASGRGWAIWPPQEDEPEYDDLVGPGDPLLGPGNGEVPEPATLILLAAGLAMVRRRKRKTWA